MIEIGRKNFHKILVFIKCYNVLKASHGFDSSLQSSLNSTVEIQWNEISTISVLREDIVLRQGAPACDWFPKSHG